MQTKVLGIQTMKYFVYLVITSHFFLSAVWQNSNMFLDMDCGNAE